MTNPLGFLLLYIILILAGYPDLVGPNPNNPGGMSTKDCFRAPGSTEVLCFAFRVDNTGPPQSIEEVLHAYEIVRARYVNVRFFALYFDYDWKSVLKITFQVCLIVSLVLDGEQSNYSR